MQALVLDGNLKSALSVVRSLGRKGVSVTCGAQRQTGMACHSRYVRERFVYPSPYTNQTGFINAIKNIAKKSKTPPVVYAFSDATYLTLFQYRDALKDIVVLKFPEETALEIAFDKAATYSKAKILGVPTIQTHMPTIKDEVVRLSDELSYPAVVKTRRSVTWKESGGMFGTAHFVQDKTELQECFYDLEMKTGETPLVQPRIEGEEYGVEILSLDGKVIAEVVHHRMRSLSPTGGASVMKETVADSDIVKAMSMYAHKFIAELMWTGPIMVEFKVDSDSREPLLMEINGRWWGSLPLAVASGIDFPYLYYQMASGEVLPDFVGIAKDGIVTRHFLGDVRHLLRVMFAHDPMRSHLYPSRAKALRDFFRRTKGSRGDIFAWNDLKPSFMEYIDILKR
ncbi:ATP-grasp domain-containing protein [Candidatus Pacebacteria bacterium]|nr:ATP-grasp domain-containing protein [Candidatus Paceibacterota bacterium]